MNRQRAVFTKIIILGVSFDICVELGLFTNKSRVLTSWCQRGAMHCLLALESKRADPLACPWLVGVAKCSVNAALVADSAAIISNVGVKTFYPALGETGRRGRAATCRG